MVEEQKKIMPLHHFDLFARTITDLPVWAVVRALDLECKMLQDDFEHQRLTLSDDAFSILYFRQFVRMAKFDEPMSCVKPLPPDHVEFYKKTIVRLVHSNQLPPSAMEQFDHRFHLIH
jgi:hypothetical protein